MLAVLPPPLVQPFARLALWLAWWLEHPPPVSPHRWTHDIPNIYRISTCWLPWCLNPFHLCSSPSHVVWSLHSGTPYSLHLSEAFSSVSMTATCDAGIFLKWTCHIATSFRWNSVACSSRTSTPRSIFSTTSQDTSSEKWRKSMSNVSNVSNLKSITECLRLELELGDVVGRARGHACPQIPDRLVMIMIDVRQRK